MKGSKERIIIYSDKNSVCNFRGIPLCQATKRRRKGKKRGGEKKRREKKKEREKKISSCK